ncbi:MAG: hypothetical protein QXO72_04865, partial [Sulfolobales archaeon]
MQFTILDSFDLLVRIVLAITSIAISYYLGTFISNYIKRLKLKAPPELVYSIMKTVKLVMLFIGFLVALSLLGLELSGILIAAGFAGIVVGLA